MLCVNRAGVGGTHGTIAWHLKPGAQGSWNTVLACSNESRWAAGHMPCAWQLFFGVYWQVSASFCCSISCFALGFLPPQISAANALKALMEQRLERANAALVRTFQVRASIPASTSVLFAVVLFTQVSMPIRHVLFRCQQACCLPSAAACVPLLHCGAIFTLPSNMTCCYCCYCCAHRRRAVMHYRSSSHTVCPHASRSTCCRCATVHAQVCM